MTDQNFIVEIECKVIAEILQEGKEAVIKASQYIGEENFYSTVHKIFFGVMQSLLFLGEEINIVTVSKYLRSHAGELDYHFKKLSPNGDTKKVAGELIVKLNEIACISLEPSNHLQTNCLAIRENSLRAKLVEFHSEKIQSLKNGQDVFEALETSQEELLNIYTNIENVKSYTSFSSAVEVALEELEREKNGEVVRVKTGFSDLDKIILGLENGRLYVLGAEEKIGKSLFVAHVALNAAQQNIPIGLLSLEMKASEVAKRYLAMSAGVQAIRDLNVVELRGASKKFHQLPLYIYDVSANSKQLLAVTNKLFLEKKIRLLIVDYLQLVEADKKTLNKTDEVNSIVKSLKRLAMNLNIPVLVVASLTIKAIYNRAERKPRASDLRDSGQIPYDADCILFLWKPDEEKPNYRELFVERSRYSELGIPVGLYFDESNLTFKQVARCMSSKTFGLYWL